MKRSHLIEAIVALVAIVGLYGVYSSGVVDHAVRQIVRLAGPAIVDGFPLGESIDCNDHCAEWTALAQAALAERERDHPEIVGARWFKEGHIADLYGPGVPYARSGMLVVALFELIDGSQRATGVYCGVGGCRGWAEWPH